MNESRLALDFHWTSDRRIDRLLFFIVVIAIAMNESLSHLREGCDPLPDHLESPLLVVLSTPSLNKKKFRSTCDEEKREDRAFLFGRPGSETRR
jgi:hypothetical protein